jgi:phenylacetate-CoA ligase
MSPGIGRLFDDIKRPDGGKMSGNVLGYHLTTSRDFLIGQMQVIQESLTEFKVLITDKPRPGQEVFDFIRSKMAAILGEGITVDIEVVKDIPREKSGKTRYVISKVGSTRN